MKRTLVISAAIVALLVATANVLFADEAITGDSGGEAPPSAGVLQNESDGGGRGGAYIPGSIRLLTTAREAVTGGEWRLVSYRTTSWECWETRLYAGQVRAGMAGGCGTPEPGAVLHATCGGVRYHYVPSEPMLNVCSGRAAPIAVKVTGITTTGRVIAVTPEDGFFILAAQPGEFISRIKAIDITGNVLAVDEGVTSSE